MVNMYMRAAANSHHSRIPAAAAVCVCAFVSRHRRSRGSARKFFLAPRRFFFCSYVGKSDSQSVLVRIEVMGAEGSDFVSLL